MYCIDRCNFENFVLYINSTYIKSTRKTKEDIYEHEYTDENYKILIDKLKNIKASEILSGYDDECMASY